jgi:hypothetical protein
VDSDIQPSSGTCVIVCIGHGLSHANCNQPTSNS